MEDTFNDYILKNSAFIPYRIIYNARLLGLHCNRNWVKKFISMGYLGYLSEEEQATVLACIGSLLSVFRENYKDNFELVFEPMEYGKTMYQVSFRVLYPKFVISNSKGIEHTIRDLIVIHNFEIKDGNLVPTSLRGGRLTRNILEIASQYQQSHLSSITVDTYRKDPFVCTGFCMGSSTDVSILKAELKTDFMQGTIDYNKFELFLYTVDSMVKWESLEGVPYRHITNIPFALNTAVSSYDEKYADNIVKAIINQKIPLDFNFYLDKGFIKIKEDRKASDLIKKVILEKHSYDTYSSMLVTYSPSQKVYLKMQLNKPENIKYSIDPSVTTVFKGVEIKPKILSINRKDEKPLTIENYIVFPKLLQHVLRNLEERIYKKNLVQIAVKKHYTLKYA